MCFVLDGVLHNNEYSAQEILLCAASEGLLPRHQAIKTFPKDEFVISTMLAHLLPRSCSIQKIIDNDDIQLTRLRAMTQSTTM